MVFSMGGNQVMGWYACVFFGYNCISMNVMTVVAI
jgi:hypothetical protein